MRINLSKTKIIVFRNGGIIKVNETWFFNGQRLKTVSAYKYMGFFVTPKLIWTSAKEGLAVQARKAILTMSKLQHAVGYFDFVEYFKLFDSMVKPIFIYGSEIWGYEMSDIIENVQIVLCKKYLKLPTCMFKASALGECGRYPLYVDYFTRCIKYWLRLTRMVDTPISAIKC